MQKYETIFILQSQLEEEKTEELIEKFKSVIEREGGQISNLDKWGKRKLAYEVKKQKEGFYVLMNYTAPAHITDQLERSFKITDGVLRYLIVREDE